MPPARTVAVPSEPQGANAHELGHLGAERARDVVSSSVCVLERVVENSGGHDVVGVAGVAEQRRHLEWVKDERRVVGVAALPAVEPLRELKRFP